MNEKSMRRKKLWRDVKKAKSWYLFLLPTVIFLVVFCYSPLYFLQIAFRDYRITRPVLECDWVGMEYFAEVFKSPGFWDAFRNTLIINSYKLLICFPAPIILALLMNEIKSDRFNRPIQTIVYLPNFISWIVVANIITNFLAYNGGLFNNIITLFGGDPVLFLGEKRYFRGMLVHSDLWKKAGYGMIIYLAALTGIDPALYDAADVDGAGRWQKLWSITLPELSGLIVVMLVLNLGGILGGSFDQIQALLDDRTIPVGDTLATYVYRVGITNFRYSFSTAAGLFNSVISAVFLFGSNFFAKKMGSISLF